MAENYLQYQGNANLAQGSAGGGPGLGWPEDKVSNEAIDRIMYFHFLEKQDKWARQNVLDDRDAQLAADMSQFPVEDWPIEADSKRVWGDIGDFTNKFADHPDGVRLRVENGRVLNADHFKDIQGARNKVGWGIGRANARTSTYHAIRKMIDALPDGDPRRALWEAHLAKEIQKPLEEDLVLPADIETYDFSQLKPVPIGSTNELPYLEDYTQKTVLGWPDINATIAQEQMKMQDPITGRLPREAYGRQLNKYLELMGQVQQKHTPEEYANMSQQQLLTEMAQLQDPQAATMAWMAGNYFTQSDFMTKGINGIVDENNKPRIQVGSLPPSLDMRHLDVGSVIAIMAAAKGEYKAESTIQYTGAGERRMQDQLAYGAAQQRVAAIQNKTATPADYGYSALTTYYYMSAYPRLSGKNTEDISDNPNLANAVDNNGQPNPTIAGKSIKDFIPNWDPQKNSAYRLDLTPEMTNALRLANKSGHSEQVNISDDPQHPVTGIKPVDMDILGAYVIPEGSFTTTVPSTQTTKGTVKQTSDPDKNRYIIFYQDQGDKKIYPVVMSNAQLWQSSARAGDFTGAGGPGLLKVQQGVNQLREQLKLPMLPKPSEVIKLFEQQQQQQQQGGGGQPQPVPVNKATVPRLSYIAHDDIGHVVVTGKTYTYDQLKKLIPEKSIQMYVDKGVFTVTDQGTFQNNTDNQPQVHWVLPSPYRVGPLLPGEKVVVLTPADKRALGTDVKKIQADPYYIHTRDFARDHPEFLAAHPELFE